MHRISLSHASRPVLLLVAATLTTATFAACGAGGGAGPAEAPEEGTDEKPAAVKEDVDVAAGPPVEPATPFDQMPPGDKMQYMKNEVAPHMAKVFQEFSADYTEFGCPTCHGPGANQGDFAMPTDSLPALDEEEMQEHPEMTDFMSSKVVPNMATLLGEQPYDEATGEGFGCYDCHMKKE